MTNYTYNENRNLELLIAPIIKDKIYKILYPNSTFIDNRDKSENDNVKVSRLQNLLKLTNISDVEIKKELWDLAKATADKGWLRTDSDPKQRALYKKLLAEHESGGSKKTPSSGGKGGPKEGATATGPDGKKLTYRGGKWV